MSFSDLHLLLWKNIDGLVWAFGSLAFSRISDSLFLKILAEVIGVAMISGVIRMVRRGNGLAYGLFALGSCLLLIIWHFPPNERFVYPMFPLALAGLWTELEHLTAMLRAGFQHQDRSQRVAAGFILTAVGLVFGACLVTQGYMDAVFMPEDARQYRAYRDAQREIGRAHV